MRRSLTYYSDDFWATTSNKQLTFFAAREVVDVHGRVAVVVPDSVLFEGGAGKTVRRKLLHECDVHTPLRCRLAAYLLRVRYKKEVRAEYLHPILGPLKSGRGRRPEVARRYAPLERDRPLMR